MDTWALVRARVIYEDEAVLALDKPAGVAVVGDNSADDLLTLARAAGEDVRPVHRIDKVTSGVILLAKTAAAHAALTRQFNERTVEKTYLCVVRPGGLPEGGEIDLPLTTGRKNRVRIAGQRESIAIDPATKRWSLSSHPSGDRIYPAVTRIERLWNRDDLALIAARPMTGRRHQIRVHLAWIGHAIVGDPLFSPKGEPSDRTLLHAWRLAFAAPDGSGRRIAVEAPLDDEFRAALPLPADDLDAILDHVGEPDS